MEILTKKNIEDKDWWEGFIDLLLAGADKLNLTMTLVFTAMAAGVSRTAISPEKRTFGSYLRGLVLAIFVGYTVFQFINDYDFTQGQTVVIVAVTAFSADDILLGLLALSEKITTRPREVLNAVLSFLIKK